jgi:BolA family transcriptional regulator, general stress-responsive regulator
MNDTHLNPGVPTAAALEAALREALAPTALEVIDESASHAGHAGANGLGYGTHFRVRIASPLFAGRSRVAQHRLVYDALLEFTAAGLHALAIEVRP